MVAEIYKAILISIRVLETDEDLKEHVSVLGFPALEATTSR